MKDLRLHRNSWGGSRWHQQRVRLRLTVSTVVALAAALLCSIRVLPVDAYVGPGAGISLLGAAIGLIVAVVTSVGLLLFWPLRRLLKLRRHNRARAAVDKEAEIRTTEPRRS